MIAPVIQNITLDEFLTLGNIDDSPAWEYVNGTVMQKPMSKLRYAIIQKRLLSEIDNLLHGLRYGCQLAWLIDPDNSSVIVFMPNQLPLQKC